ncbi:MAG: response regulator [Anaerolineales bacterium]
MASVLIVDDEKQTVDLISRVVTLIGHEPLAANGCAAALAILEVNQPDLVLLDLMMPEIDGYETLRRMRARPGTAETPIVVVTASQELDVEERVADAGGDKVYYKPISMAMLSDAIDEFVGKVKTAPLPGQAA